MLNLLTAQPALLPPGRGKGGGGRERGRRRRGGQ
jgi:hypothetical protein